MRAPTFLPAEQTAKAVEHFDGPGRSAVGHKVILLRLPLRSGYRTNKLCTKFCEVCRFGEQFLQNEERRTWSTWASNHSHNTTHSAVSPKLLHTPILQFLVLNGARTMVTFSCITKSSAGRSVFSREMTRDNAVALWAPST